MDKEDMNDFILKFKKLNKENQKFIIAIQQAMYFAQTSESKLDEKSDKKKGNAYETGII